MFKIMMNAPSIGHAIDMPEEKHESVFKACHYADLFKKNNPKATFIVINDDNGDIEYEV